MNLDGVEKSFFRLIEKNITALGLPLDVRGKSVKVLNGGRVDSVHDVVVEQQPNPVTFDDRYVMPCGRSK